MTFVYFVNELGVESELREFRGDIEGLRNSCEYKPKDTISKHKTLTTVENCLEVTVWTASMPRHWLHLLRRLLESLLEYREL
jgi:hypothetical protein